MNCEHDCLSFNAFDTIYDRLSSVGGASCACVLSEIIISGVIKALDGIFYRLDTKGRVQKLDSSN